MTEPISAIVLADVSRILQLESLDKFDLHPFQDGDNVFPSTPEHSHLRTTLFLPLASNNPASVLILRR